MMILSNYPFSRQEKFYRILEKIFPETLECVTPFATNRYKHRKQVRGKFFFKNAHCSRSLPNLSAYGLCKNEELFCHKCSMLRFGPKPALAKKQVLGIVSFGKIEDKNNEIGLVLVTNIMIKERIIVWLTPML